MFHVMIGPLDFTVPTVLESVQDSVKRCHVADWLGERSQEVTEIWAAATTVKLPAIHLTTRCHFTWKRQGQRVSDVKQLEPGSTTIIQLLQVQSNLCHLQARRVTAAAVWTCRCRHADVANTVNESNTCCVVENQVFTSPSSCSKIKYFLKL